jgi:acetyl-CoA carboxylase alpha subunit
MAAKLKTHLSRQLRELGKLNEETLLQARYAKFRGMGILA